MKLQAFSVYDSAAKRFAMPFFADTIEVALRMFRALVNSGDSQVSKYPEDYTLFHIGEFDQELGEVRPSSPRSLGVAITFRELRSADGDQQVARVTDGRLLKDPVVELEHAQEVADA